MIELTVIEQTVLELIPRGTDRKVKVSEIAKLIDLTERDLQSVISTLRRKGVPILSARGINSGLYIATTQEELIDGLQAYKRQQQNMSDTIKELEKTDVKHWHELIA